MSDKTFENPPTPAPKLNLADAARPPIPMPSTSTVGLPATKALESKSKWNTKNLGMRLGADFVSAATAASLVAPVISIVDRSITENASGRKTLGESLKSSFKNLLLRPHTVIFSKPVAFIIMVYGGTYLTANTLDTATSTVQNKPATLVTSGTTKFASSSAANAGLSVVKDQMYVKLFGPSGPPRPVPLPSYGLFLLRDCMTIFASFNIPPLLGPALTARMSEEWQKKVSGQTIAQFAAPAMVQFLSTPIHLLGLDLYNRPASEAVTRQQRWAAIKKNWNVSSWARVCRIVPAFGFGGTVNYKVRSTLMGKLA
ncbi:hypothetical protein PG993_002475 [Apiospora rasikravindrae]|uniref:Sequence orphan n=1 Tax=Apiospora rasikravindrae TaxID=990691 RepID=A0ABR1TWR6_9PEZI